MENDSHIQALYDAWGQGNPRVLRMSYARLHSMNFGGPLPEEPAAETENPTQKEPEMSEVDVPEGHTHFKSSDGAEHLVPTEHLEHARIIDPNLQIIAQK